MENTQNAGNTAQPEKTFTQAELDGIVQDRLAREKVKFEKTLEEQTQALQQKERELLEKESSLTEKLNTRLINAEIDSLDGYNSKLLSRLIDRATIKVNDDNSITGLREAAMAVEKEYPTVRQAGREPVIPPNPAGDPFTSDPIANAFKPPQ